MILNESIKDADSTLMKMGLGTAAALTKLLYKTLKVQTECETYEIFDKKNSSAIFCWHGAISMLPYVNIYYRKKKPVVGLVSSSRDGSYLSYFFSKFGIGSERGSSNKNGGRSAINLIRILRSGGNICITPDGPRGPIKQAKSGMLTVCEKSPDSRMIFVRIKFDNAWKFNSWDKFTIPKPFSKIVISTSEYPDFESFKSDAETKGITHLQLCEDLLD